MSTANKQQFTDADAFQLRRIKLQMNKHEWSEPLDKFLQECVVRNYFNFDLIAMEVSTEAQNLGHLVGATNAYTSEKCRFRWSYLHLKRKKGKPVKYIDYTKTQSAPKKAWGKENSQTQNAKKPHQIKSNGTIQIGGSAKTNLLPSIKQIELKTEEILDEEMAEAKAIEKKRSLLSQGATLKYIEKQELKSYSEIEQQLWKNNITYTPRQKKDFLDISNEDFKKHKTVGIDGQSVNPSTFNIMKDSLRGYSNRLQDKLIENLPDMNTNESEESDSSAAEVVPLDFRTALVSQDNKIVIQAKPVAFKTSEEDMKELEKMKEEIKESHNAVDDYLKQVQLEPFKEEEDPILIDPGMNINTIFGGVDLPCNEEARSNNIVAGKSTSSKGKSTKKAPSSKKQYDTDSEGDSNGESDGSYSSRKVRPLSKVQDAAFLKQEQEKALVRQAERIAKIAAEKANEDYNPTFEKVHYADAPTLITSDNLNFDNILDQMGVDINDFAASSDDQSQTVSGPATKAEKTGAKDLEQSTQALKSQLDLIASIMQENKANKGAIPNLSGLLQSLTQPSKAPAEVPAEEVAEEAEGDSECAPLSAIVDEPVVEEPKLSDKEVALESARLATSSEDEQQINTFKSARPQQNSAVSAVAQPRKVASPKATPQSSRARMGVTMASDSEDDYDSAEEEAFFAQQKALAKKKAPSAAQSNMMEAGGRLYGSSRNQHEERAW